MTLFWKSAAALGIAVAGLSATAVPANAQYYDHRDYGHRDGWRGDRWDKRPHWHEQRRYWRHPSGYNRGYRYGYRQRCWTEWRRGYYGHRVRVRICR